MSETMNHKSLMSFWKKRLLYWIGCIFFGVTLNYVILYMIHQKWILFELPQVFDLRTVYLIYNYTYTFVYQCFSTHKTVCYWFWFDVNRVNYSIIKPQTNEVLRLSLPKSAQQKYLKTFAHNLKHSNVRTSRNNNKYVEKLFYVR